MRREHMRGILLTAAGTAALALSAPAAALAGSRHHRHHEDRHAHHARVGFPHHQRVFFRHLGPDAAGASGLSTTSGSSSTTPPTTTSPPTTTTPTTSEENAGKVKSYTGGVLTLTLENGSTVSGTVTVNTGFQCINPSATPTPGNTDGDDNGSGDDQSQGDRNQQGGPQGSQADGQWQQGSSDGTDQGNGWGEDDDEAPISTEPPCDSSALTEGTKVRAAELRVAPGGAEFEWITLVR